MLKYFIPLLIIYFIYIYDKKIINHKAIAHQNSKYISLLIEKNLLIFIVSVVAVLIIWNHQCPKETYVYVMLLILINLTLWIRLARINYYSTEAIQLLEQETFISSVSKPVHHSYISKEAKKQFETDFLNECYEHKLLIPGFKPIIKPNKVRTEDAIIRTTTIELALNSDDMFAVQQEENKCIIANYIPSDLELVSNNNITHTEQK